MLKSRSTHDHSHHHYPTNLSLKAQRTRKKMAGYAPAADDTAALQRRLDALESETHSLRAVLTQRLRRENEALPTGRGGDGRRAR